MTTNNQTASDSAFVLRDSEAAKTPAVEVPLGLAGHPTKIGNHKVTYWRKEVVPIGHFEDPDRGTPIIAPKDRAEKWIRNFNLMKERKHRVPLTVKHKDIEPDEQDRAIESGQSRGYVEALEIGRNSRDEDAIFATLQAIGEDAERDVVRNDVSICVRPNYRDCRKNEYDEALTHIALTSDPKINGMDPAELIAASRGLPIYEFSRTQTASATSPGQPEAELQLDRGSPTGGANMAQKVTPEHVAKIKKIIGDSEGPATADAVNDDNAIDSAIGHMDRMASKRTGYMCSREQLDAAKKLTGKTDLTEETATNAVVEHGLKLSRDLEAANAKATTLELGRTTVPPLGDEVKVERSLRVGQNLDTLVNHGYSPALVAALRPILIGNTAALNEIMLAREAGAEDCRAMKFMQALKDNPPAPPTGVAKTEAELLELARKTDNPAEPKPPVTGLPAAGQTAKNYVNRTYGTTPAKA